MDWKLLLQIVGVVLGLLYLWFEYKADIRLWAVGVIMPMVHGALYYRSGLYADFAMQLYYIAAGVYGFVVWYRAQRAKDAAHKHRASAVRHASVKILATTAAVYAMLHVVMYGLLVTFTDSTVPVWDSCTTALAMVAMWLLSRKYVEQWLVWLAVDVITVGLYIYKGIPFTAGLYVLYCVLAVAGWQKWRKMAQTDSKSCL